MLFMLATRRITFKNGHVVIFLQINSKIYGGYKLRFIDNEISSDK